MRKKFREIQETFFEAYISGSNKCLILDFQILGDGSWCTVWSKSVEKKAEFKHSFEGKI